MSVARFIAIIVAIVVLGTVSRSHANPEECKEAVSEYKAAKEDIAGCLSGNDGHDDCSSEFETLKSAQDDLEDAVSKYESKCN
jgi:hypothetical protein